MTPARKTFTVLLAEDDADDQALIKRAFERSRFVNDVRIVENGEELMDYLQHRGAYTDPAEAPWPGLILLDLNMPLKSGREALREIKQNPRLRAIPIIILTTSASESDVQESYSTGANAYITKPVTFDGLTHAVQALDRFWFELVHLPSAA
jgi:two-component system response regulator